MKVIAKSMRPSKLRHTASVMVCVRLSIMDDGELEADAAAVGLDKDGVVELELVRVLGPALPVTLVGVEESRVDIEDENEVVSTLDEVWDDAPYSEVSEVD